MCDKQDSIEVTHPHIVEWLDNYEGDFDFYLSLRDQAVEKGWLSDRQIEAVERAIEREEARKHAKRAEPMDPEAFTYKAGELIRVSKWFAKQVAELSGYAHPHYILEIISVQRETEKAILAEVKLSAQRTNYCMVCGALLTNPVSVINGIGPICSQRSGVDYNDKALAQLAEQLAVVKSVTEWIPKSCIKSTEEAKAPEACAAKPYSLPDIIYLECPDGFKASIRTDLDPLASAKVVWLEHGGRGPRGLLLALHKAVSDSLYEE